MLRPLAILAALAVAVALPATAPAAPAKKKLYVNLGDSYATGVQDRGATRQGYADQLIRPARRRGWNLKLVNFGCGGATSTSILETEGCEGRAPGGAKYGGRTQAAAAERFLRRNRGAVALITVSIGGNDVTACARMPDPVACVGPAVETTEKNVRTLVKRLRRAAGRKVRIVGLTYPDVILGEWVRGNQTLANLSLVAFREIINPALKRAYASAGGKFVDITAGTGAYGPMSETTTLAPYGAIPVPVARVCELTFYCESGNIHARRAGYRLMAQLIAASLPRRG